MTRVDFDSALLALAMSALQALAAWAGLVVVLGAWRPTAALARALTPRALRFLIVAGLASAVTTGGTVGAAQADELDGLRLPDRLTDGPAPTATRLVQPGDSLWSIAAEGSPGSDVATVARETQRWYDANRVTVGPDPDLIRPGQRLSTPRENS
jgi:nucleoid-associated protein YgaU